MKEIAVISGKGGTGKTSIATSLAYLGAESVIVADCDVDAADMHLLLRPDFADSKDFYSGKIAHIDLDKCTNCGECKSTCRFNAIEEMNGSCQINTINCEGCGYCSIICPVKAIEMLDNLTGKYFVSKTRLNNTLVHAELNIGAENSGKLVSKVRKEAKLIAEKTSVNYTLIDGSPGIGCPVIASITGVDYVIIVTEPTISGLHDLNRVLQLIKKMELKAGCIINKKDLNQKVCYEIKKFLQENNIEILAELPYNNVFTEAITQEKTIVEYSINGKISDQLKICWKKLQK